MKPIYLPLSALLVVGAMAACEQRDPVAEEAGTIPSATSANDSANAAASAPGPIPASIRGHWGLTPADCISDRGDAKGSLEIGPDYLKFYESRAVPGTSIETEADAISGNWNFTGEGQQWSKYVSLQLQGKVLNRTDRNPVASYDYARC